MTLHVVFLSLAVMLSASNSFRFLGVSRLVRDISKVGTLHSSVSVGSVDVEEVLVVPPTLVAEPAVQKLLSIRPTLKLLPNPITTNIRWSAYRQEINIDSTELELLYLGSKKMNDLEAATVWHNSLNKRLNMLNAAQSADENFHRRPLQYMEAGKYQKEVDTAISIVTRASYISRALQQQKRSSKLNKLDTSPVTIVDYAVQAMVLHTLHTRFPQDTFVAEEDSSYLRDNLALADEVRHVVHIALGGNLWTREELFSAIDLGSSDERKTKTARAWVLDPIDGTKGYIRNEHYCIALGLLDYEPAQSTGSLPKRRAVLSVLGCPNLSLSKVLAAAAGDAQAQETLSHITPAIDLPLVETPVHPTPNTSDDDHSHQLFDHDRGSVYFAVQDFGAYAKSLDMSIGLGYACTVNQHTNPAQMLLCESREALAPFSRSITAQVRQRWQMARDFVRLDGQCKHCLVGAGSVEGSLRLPPQGYREKIWDHLPGVHFILEAGGQVTDFAGRKLDFSAGSLPSSSDSKDGRAKELSTLVEGVVVSNGLVHTQLLQAVNEARVSLGII